jgi:hypothetical protein
MTTNPTTRPTSSVRSIQLAVVALAAVAVVIAAYGFGGFGRNSGGAGPLPTGSPTASPSGSPSVSPSPVATPTPTPKPTRDPNAPPIKVRLTTANGNVIDLDIVDYSQLIVAAEAGVPGDGASVEWGSVKVEQLDSRTLRLTWTNTPGDGRMWMTLDEAGRKLVLAQPEFDGDSIAFDRVLVLAFAEDVEADEFEIILITSNHADS